MQLITITGLAGVGKDTVAHMLSDMTGVPVLVSYTTRPMREGEENGREHHFVEECHIPKDQMLAYTMYGGYEYWTSLSQLASLPDQKAIYVIDEAGLKRLQANFPDISLITIYVSAIKRIRIQRGIAFDRMHRDATREAVPVRYYNHHIQNNRGMSYLRTKVKAIAEKLSPGD